MSWLRLALVPPLLALGLWLLGAPFDWVSWKTYTGLAVIAFAVGAI